MSEQELNECEQMLKDLLLNDNTKRKLAEGKLSICLSSIPNKAKLILYCSQLLLKTNTDLGVQTYCAIIIRKVFLPSEKGNPDALIKVLSSENKEILKRNLLSALNTITNKSLRKQIADAASTFFSSLVENEQKWDELLQYSMNLLSSDLNEQNIINVEFGLHLITNLYSVASDELEKGMKVFLSIFPVYFKSNSLSLKAKSVQCLTEILCGTVTKKEVKQFKDLIFNVLETTLACLKENDNDNLKICLDSIKDLSNCEPKILRKDFQDIFILMGKISQNAELDENLREMCFEIIVTLVEAMPKLFTGKEGEQKLANFVAGLFKYAMELDQTIDEEWLNPNKITYICDEFIPEKKLDLSTSLLTRLFEVVDEDKLLNLTSNNIVQLINHSNNQDWKYKYIAYITVAEIAGNIKKLSSIEQLITMIINDLYSPNIKVQYASLYCIAELSEAHNPDFQNKYHKDIIPKVVQLLTESKSLRVQLEVCDSLEMFVEHMTDSDAALYLQSSLDALFNLFMKNEVECPPSLKQGILGVVQEFIHASENEFIKYSEKCLQILLEYLSNILTNNINGNLVGPMMETISEIGPLCPDLFKKYLITLVNTLIQINQKMPDFKGNIANYLLSTWEKLIPSLQETNKEKIPEIVSSLIVLLQKPPEMSISSNPEVKIDVNEFFSDKKAEKEEKKNVELKTSETEEFTTFIETLNSFLTQCPSLYNIEHIKSLYQICQKLISYPNNDIKSEISNVYPNCIDILIKIETPKEQVDSAAKEYIAIITKQLSQETDYSVIISFLDNIRDIIKSAKQFLTTEEINNLSKEIFTLFNRIEKGRKNLLKEQEEAEKEFEEEKKTGDNKINSDDEDDDQSQEEVMEDIKDKIDETENVMKSISDFFGSLFETHGYLTNELVDEIIKNYIPTFLKESSSNFEKLLALLLLGDMAEFLKQDLLSKIWGDICTILIKYSPHPNYEIRNAACYGLGVFAQSTTKDFKDYGQNLITAVINVINLPIDKALKKTEKENLKFARDNAISALGKVIKYHGQEFPNELNNLLDLWVNSMPIKQDKEEAKINIQFLLDILMKEPNKILGENNKNLGKVIVILTEGYKTATNDEMEKNIEKFTVGIKSNTEYNNILLDTVKKQKEKLQNKIKKLFKI